MRNTGKYNTKTWEEVNVLYIVDQNHQRSVIVVEQSRNFKGSFASKVGNGAF